MTNTNKAKKSNDPYIKKHIKQAKEIISGQRKSYTHDEIISMLKKEKLW